METETLNWDTTPVLEKDYVLLGEVHGVKENLEVLSSLVQYVSKQYEIVLALEWPTELSENINNYLQGKEALDWGSWEFSSCPDGRISMEHIKFIEELKIKYPRVKEVRCVSVKAASWEERDKKMGDNLLAAMTENPSRKIIAILGNFHATKLSFEFEGVRMIPAASYLPKDNSIAIKLVYLSGKFLNVGVKQFEQKPGENSNLSQQIVPSEKAGFDFELVIEEAHPLTALRQTSSI
jgi:hypothetical protein